MKKTTHCDFSELFRYTMRAFDLHWNTCCDLFHRSEALNYGGHSEFDLTCACEYVPESIYEEVGEEKKDEEYLEILQQMSKEDVLQIPDKVERANVIIVKFMLHHDLKKVLIT